MMADADKKAMTVFFESGELSLETAYKSYI